MPFSLFTFETIVTNLGDSAVLMALVAVVVPYLWLCGQKREAMLTFLGLAVTAASMATLKMVVLVCSAKLPLSGLVSPSGHAAMTTVVYGMLTLILARIVGRPVRYAAIVLYALVVVGVAATRVLLWYHSRLEVAVGLLVGAVILCAFAALLWQRPPSPGTALLKFRPAVLAALALAIVALMSGNKLPAEGLIDGLALGLNAHIGLCE